jgi:hypothetical protein
MFSYSFGVSRLVAAVKAGWIWAVAAFLLVGVLGLAIILGSASRTTGVVWVLAPGWNPIWASDISLAGVIDREITLRGNLRSNDFSIDVMTPAAGEAVVVFSTLDPTGAERIVAELKAIEAQLRERWLALLLEARGRLQERLDRSRRVFEALSQRLSAPEALAGPADISAGLLGFDRRITDTGQQLQVMPTEIAGWVIGITPNARPSISILIAGLICLAFAAALATVFAREAIARSRNDRREVRET